MPHHNERGHKITRRRETAAVRLARLEAEAKEREREANALGPGSLRTLFLDAMNEEMKRE